MYGTDLNEIRCIDSLSPVGGHKLVVLEICIVLAG